MNSSVRIDDLQRWQMCVGMCLVCGQPLGLNEASAKANGKAAVDSDETDEEILMNGLSLAEECPVRLCMMRFRLLGKREECHIIDRYTDLEKKGSDEKFEKIFDKKQKVLATVHPAFEAFENGIIKTPQLEIAVATCRRVAKPLTFSGCRACNLAMEKSSAHANAVYRCAALTADADVPDLEENKQDSIKTKKLLEQIALYFEWNAGTWSAKSGEKLLQDTCLWRCIAHLYCWGRNAKFRSRLVCIFHASNYMFEKSSFKGSVSLEDWHIHIFQPFYMQAYAATTWFGMSQSEAAAIFDFSHKRGAQWVEIVTEKLESNVLPALERWAEQEISLNSIQNFKDRFFTSVNSEKRLMKFVAHKEGTQKGLEKLFSYYLFNVSGKTDLVVLEHFRRFMKELCKVLLSLNQK